MDASGNLLWSQQLSDRSGNIAVAVGPAGQVVAMWGVDVDFPQWTARIVVAELER